MAGNLTIFHRASEPICALLGSSEVAKRIFELIFPIFLRLILVTSELLLGVPGLLLAAPGTFLDAPGTLLAPSRSPEPMKIMKITLTFLASCCEDEFLAPQLG